MSIAVPPTETAWVLHAVIGFDAITQDDIAAILEQATRFAEGVLAPLDRVGDTLGARLVDGAVLTPPGLKDAFRVFAEGGWLGITAPEAHGGQGLPEALALAVLEPISSANMAFGLCPLLTRDAILLLVTHATEEQQARLLPPMLAGRTTATMCLTEATAGSDLAGVRTRAEPDAAGWRISGEKIFISFGDHDWGDNILHMVLARLPGAPAGSAGISLFAVPKVLADGTRNPVRTVSLEHKLGIRASPTAVLAFEAAWGEMIGPANRGLGSMFAMRNAARLGVAMQGVAVAERAFRRAAAFAAERRQGGSAIVAHPDVRRLLWTMRALALGGRLLTLHAAQKMERDPARAALLIPVARPGRRMPASRPPRSACRYMAEPATSRRVAPPSTCATPASRRSTRAPTASRRSPCCAAASGATRGGARYPVGRGQSRALRHPRAAPRRAGCAQHGALAPPGRAARCRGGCHALPRPARHRARRVAQRPGRGPSRRAGFRAARCGGIP
jgi:alkylation response protein AidB-like acyl-CoA dehydrogenase